MRIKVEQLEKFVFGVLSLEEKEGEKKREHWIGPVMGVTIQRKPKIHKERLQLLRNSPA